MSQWCNNDVVCLQTEEAQKENREQQAEEEEDEEGEEGEEKRRREEEKESKCWNKPNGGKAQPFKTRGPFYKCLL